MSTVLPEACHIHFETCLDFIYGAQVVFDKMGAVALLKIADILQVEALKAAAKHELASISPEAAPDVHVFAHELSAGTGDVHMSKVKQRAFESIRCNLACIPVDKVALLDVDTLLLLLGDDSLPASEDVVFKIVCACVQKDGIELAKARQLWECCRFPFLPIECVPDALQQAPADLVAKGSLGSICSASCGMGSF